MDRLYTSGDFSSSCSSDTDDGISSDDENTKKDFKRRSAEKTDLNSSLRKSASQNIIFKLNNREVGCSIICALNGNPLNFAVWTILWAIFVAILLVIPKSICHLLYEFTLKSTSNGVEFNRSD